MGEQKLRECPFCGEIPSFSMHEERHKGSVDDPHLFICSVICDQCCLEMSTALTDDEVFAGFINVYKKWNDRVQTNKRMVETNRT